MAVRIACFKDLTESDLAIFFNYFLIVCYSSIKQSTVIATLRNLQEPIHQILEMNAWQTNPPPPPSSPLPVSQAWPKNQTRFIPWQPSGLSPDRLKNPGLHWPHCRPLVLFLQKQSPGFCDRGCKSNKKNKLKSYYLNYCHLNSLNYSI